MVLNLYYIAFANKSNCERSIENTTHKIAKFIIRVDVIRKTNMSILLVTKLNKIKIPTNDYVLMLYALYKSIKKHKFNNTNIDICQTNHTQNTHLLLVGKHNVLPRQTYSTSNFLDNLRLPFQ